MQELNFNHLKGKTCVITGGGGILGASMAEALAAAGLKTIIVDINLEAAKKVAHLVAKKYNVQAMGVAANVLDKDSLRQAKAEINERFGKIDFLINGAGGNSPKATTRVEEILPGDEEFLENSFYGLEMEGFQNVFDLNFMGTLLPTMVFTTDMVKDGKGVVINISSMNAFRPLTKIPAYSAAKSAINNFTQWLSVHLGKTGIRVNAIAPGFFLTNQNRFLLTDEKTGHLKARGHKIIASTPMGKFGNPEDINGTLLFLLSDLSEFITGIIVPVDGGYSAYGGV